MARSCHSLLIFCLLLHITFILAESAWNGYVPPGQEASEMLSFTPMYIPPGAKGYPCTSPLIQLKGRWEYKFSPRYYQKTIRSTCQKQASLSFCFPGTGIEWFGNSDNQHGIAEVYLDGKRVAEVDTSSESDPSRPRVGQRHYANYELPLGKHCLKIVNLANGCIDVNAFVVTQIEQSNSISRSQQSRSAASWTLVQQGSTGVNAMQLAVVSPTHAIVIDKVEHNPLTINGHPAWGALLDLDTLEPKALDVKSNSFCAGGTFLSNGTFINVGGNPVVVDHASPSDFGDLNGLQAVRLFHPCDDDCQIIEDPRIRMASPRWYNTVIRISDGSAMIIGGSKKGGWINNATTNNPTIEYYPPKNMHGYNGLPIPLPFLNDTLNSNLFPMAFSLPDGRVFMAANNDAMIYDWETNTEQRLPAIPNGVRVTYPMAGTGVLLPLSSKNDYAPEMLLCGGSTVDDTKPGYEISSQDPASSQCARIVLTEEGINAGWAVEQMPEARLMPDAVLLPTGKVLIVNGAGSGISGYGNVLQQVGRSNADNPVLTPVLYEPLAEAGSRFSREGMPSSVIPRMYHSVATLTPNATILIAGSNPNLDRSELKYGTEYRIETLYPPYMNVLRPKIVSLKDRIGFKEQFTLGVDIPGSSSQVEVVLMDLGFATHAVHANSRMVYLDVVESTSGKTITCKAPPNAGVYPPGPGFLYVVVDGVPSKGVSILVGDGKGPKVDDNAYENMLRNSRSVDEKDEDDAE